jgi:ubiquinone/menaquinone biosynthesis C-methylase UbiE
MGRAYDMALEIANVLEPESQIIDVGCGNGFIAHHLSVLLNTSVVGLDVAAETKARIPYHRFDGRHFPLPDQSFDAILFCYVLHHAQDPLLVLNEARRVLRDGGLMIVYEDNPAGWWDRAVCWSHNLQWQRRTGKCTFQLEHGWRGKFNASGFEVINQRRLSRWRNFAHPVARHFFVLTTKHDALPLRPAFQPAVLAATAQVGELSLLR